MLKLSTKMLKLNTECWISVRKCWNSIRNAESQYEMLKLNTECWISAFNAQQGPRGIIVVVQVGAVKIYVAAAVEAAAQGKKKDRVKLRKPCSRNIYA
jgi:hypothetical protein